MENNTWLIALAVIAIVAIVAVFGMINMTGFYVNSQKTAEHGSVDVCDMCFSNCPQNDAICIQSCMELPACQNIGQPCGETRCKPGTFCCNPLRGICVDNPGDFCIM